MEKVSQKALNQFFDYDVKNFFLPITCNTFSIKCSRYKTSSKYLDLYEYEGKYMKLFWVRRLSITRQL